MDKAKDNKLIYAARFIACLFVITIHAKIPGIIGAFVFSVSRFAVPFFFAVSGRFLLYDHGNAPVTDVSEIRKKTKRALVRLLKITGIVYLVHLAFSFCFHMAKGYSVPEYLASKFNLFEACNFLLFNSGRFVYDGSYVFDHMWFLFALIYVYALIYIFAPVLRKWYKALIGILLALLFFGELLQTYYPVRLFGIGISTWYVMRNWLFVGIPFVLIGILFNDLVYKHEKIRNLKIQAIVMIVLGVVLSFAESQLISEKEVYLGSIIIVLGILILSECVSYNGNVLYLLGKRASSNIYYFHVLIIAVLDIMAQNGLISWSVMTFKPLLVMIICFVLFCIKPLIEYRKRNS